MCAHIGWMQDAGMCFVLNLPPRAVLVDLPEGGRDLIGKVVVVLPSVQALGQRNQVP